MRGGKRRRLRFCARQHVFERRQVTLGVSLPGTTEVLEGLKDGEVVVTDGNLYLQDILRDATAVNSVRAAAAKQ